MRIQAEADSACTEFNAAPDSADIHEDWPQHRSVASERGESIATNRGDQHRRRKTDGEQEQEEASGNEAGTESTSRGKRHSSLCEAGTRQRQRASSRQGLDRKSTRLNSS